MTAKKIVHLEWENVPALTTSNNDRQQERERKRERERKERKNRQDRVLKRKTISFL